MAEGIVWMCVCVGVFVRARVGCRRDILQRRVRRLLCELRRRREESRSCCGVVVPS